MARQLWLLRHADAEPHGTRPDFERRLTERGERQARLAGVAIGRMGVEFEVLLSSPRERALRTATVAAQAWRERPGVARSGIDRSPIDQQYGGFEVHEPLSGGFDARGALAVLADAIPPDGADGRVLLVGHEPDLSTVVSELTGARIDLKKGGLAVVRLDAGPADVSPADVGPAHSRGELLVLLRPRELALIAGEPGAGEE